MARVRTTLHRDYPIGNDYDGLLRALEESYEQRGRHELSLVDTIPLDQMGAAYRLRLKRGTLEKLTPALQEGWIIQPAENSARALISQVDYDEDQLVVRCTAPRPGSRFQNKVQVVAPDFLARLRDWLSLCQGRPFPTLLERLQACDGALVDLQELGLPEEQLTRLRSGQQEALSNIGPHIMYLWGPPGTGKTFTLAQAVFSLVSRGFKVALLAPTNVAVDTAVLAVHAAYSQTDQPLVGGDLVRTGFPTLLDQLDAHPELLAWQQSLAMHQSKLRHLRARSKELEREMLTAQGEHKYRLMREKVELKQAIEETDVERSDELWRLADQAQILAATVYSALHRDEMRAFFSTDKVAVVIDEAGMVPRYSLLPLLELLGGGEAPQGQLLRPPSEVAVVLAGDPRQLAPIHSQRNERDVNGRFWLGESLMEELLNSQSSGLGGNTSLLTEQSRMDQTICRRISNTYYKGQLSTVPDPVRPRPPVYEHWPSDGLVVVDARRAELPLDSPPVHKLRYDKKKDERTLQVAVRLIREALQGRARSVLWLTPFRDQARLARKLVDANFSNHDVRAGTVHTSQGGEADLVIFDPVTVRHRWLKGLIGAELDIERLLNVAVSRGRGQVIVFAAEMDLAKNDLFRRLLHDATRWDGGPAS